MDIDRSDLAWAETAGLLERGQAERLWRALEERRVQGASVRISPATGRIEEHAAAPVRARFDLVHVTWYAGTLLIMGALGWFATLGFEAWGGPGILALGLIYATLFGAMGHRLWQSAELKLLGGLLVSAAVSMTPVVVYGLERTLAVWPARDPGAYAGFWDWIEGGWFALELATLVVGALAAWRVPFSFLLFPVALSAWFMSMDASALLFADPTQAQRGGVSALLGALLFGVCALLRARGRAHLTSWLEIAGLLAMNGGLLAIQSGTLWTKPLFLSLQLLFLVLSVRLERRAFAVAGVIGILALCGWALEWGDGEHARATRALVVGLPLLAFGVVAQARAHKAGGALGLVLGAGLLAVGLFSSWVRTDAFSFALVAYLLWQIACVAMGVLLRSRALSAVAALAIAAVLLRLADRVFHDSMVFPLVLVSIGVGVIALGVVFHKRSRALDAWVESTVPARVRAWRPRS